MEQIGAYAVDCWVASVSPTILDISIGEGELTSTNAERNPLVGCSHLFIIDYRCVLNIALGNRGTIQEGVDEGHNVEHHSG